MQNVKVTLIQFTVNPYCGEVLFLNNIYFTANSPKDSQFFYSKNPDWRPKWGEPYSENSGREILYEENFHKKNPCREKFEKFLQGQPFFFLTQ